MKRVGFAPALAGLGAALPASAFAQGYYGGPMYGYGDHMAGYGWHGWVFGPLMMIFWLAVVVGIVLVLLRLLGPQVRGGMGPAPRSGPDAIDILRERFARGEIDKAEFEERRALLDR